MQRLLFFTFILLELMGMNSPALAYDLELKCGEKGQLEDFRYIVADVQDMIDGQKPLSPKSEVRSPK